MFDEHSTSSLLPPSLPLTPAQTQWLNGYLAGLQAAYVSFQQDASEHDAANQLKPLTILYGSQTGNAEDLAYQCANLAKEYHLAGNVVEMDEFDSQALAQVERLLVIVSTYGEGDMPDNAEMFWQTMNSDEAPKLDQTFYSVLALGDSSYEHFCLAGKLWDERLEALGAQRIGERIDCDIDFESASQQWMETVLPLISSKGSQETTQSVQVASSKRGSQYNRKNPIRATLKLKRLLSSEQSSKQIMHYEIDLGESGEQYDAGDALNVIPVNRPELVQEVLECLNADENTIVSWQGDNQPLGHLLTHELEIRVPSREFFESLMAVTQDENLYRRFEQDDKTELDDFVYGKDIVDFLKAYPDAEFDAQRLVEALRPLAPRAYSISSSYNKHPGEVHLTIGNVRYEQEGRMHHGVTSTWLADLVEEGDEVLCYFAPNKHFTVPADNDAPMIMVGPGTGIAPFRGFLEEREVRGATGDNWLFFGDRTSEHDFIYAETLQKMQGSGLLTRLDLAFSRDQQQKIYVQDKMREQGEALYQWLERGAYFFICGDAYYMAKDVDKALHDIIAEHGNMSAEAAKAYVDALKKAKRYVRDVY